MKSFWLQWFVKDSLLLVLDNRKFQDFIFYLPRDNYLIQGWLAHLARHALRNSRVKYTVGSNLTGSINP